MVRLKRTPRRVLQPSLVGSVLFAFLAVGCRGDDTLTETDLDSFLSVRLETGTQYRYTVWSIDRFGDRILSSERTRTWIVHAENVSVQGFDDVTVVIDSTEGEPKDTLYFRFLASDDIYQYGFVSRWIARSESRTLPPQWDLLAAFSLGQVGTWTVGVADSAGSSKVKGESRGEELLFEVLVNGTLTAVPSYRVDFETSRLLASVWISDSPSAFLLFRDEIAFPPTSIRGEFAQLTEVATPFRPL
jgi:hypothetical protein